MLNFKIKLHRRRSPCNKTYTLCLIEYNEKITKCFAICIKDKNVRTIYPS
ncbi:hypothetical protein H311_00443 [Anncaliia algerae PRA109]|nr:hypothetical protein H311_00443 [Anncaliia algerae PRA109]